MQPFILIIKLCHFFFLAKPMAAKNSLLVLYVDASYIKIFHILWL